MISFSVDDDNTEIEFPTTASTDYGHESYSSPPLWKTSQPVSAEKCSSFSRPNQNHQQCDKSSVLRLQAILRAKRELMEMIRDVPESDYELSLKDIVKKNCQRVAQEEEISTEERISRSDGSKFKSKKRELKKKGRIEQRKSMIRSKSMDVEALSLKLFFPFSMTVPWRRSKSESSSKVSSGLLSIDRNKYAVDDTKEKSPGTGMSIHNRTETRSKTKSTSHSSSNSGRSWWISVFHKMKSNDKPESYSLLGAR